jgi:hypothetical protein
VQPVRDDDADRFGESGSFVQTCFNVPRILPAKIGKSDDGAGAAADFGVAVSIENAQAALSWSLRLIAPSGWIVEIACL